MAPRKPMTYEESVVRARKNDEFWKNHAIWYQSERGRFKRGDSYWIWDSYCKKPVRVYLVGSVNGTPNCMDEFLLVSQRPDLVEVRGYFVSRNNFYKTKDECFSCYLMSEVSRLRNKFGEFFAGKMLGSDEAVVIESLNSVIFAIARIEERYRKEAQKRKPKSRVRLTSQNKFF